MLCMFLVGGRHQKAVATWWNEKQEPCIRTMQAYGPSWEGSAQNCHPQDSTGNLQAWNMTGGFFFFLPPFSYVSYDIAFLYS